MIKIRCSHCSKLYEKKKECTKCDDCEVQFQAVLNKVMNRYAGAIKQLADK